MGLMSKIKNEFVDIIEWIDDSHSTLAWRFPRYQNEIKNGAQLIVREGQKAIFVYRGAMADTFDPGNYELKTENLPVLGTLQGWKYGFDSPFRSEVYFINTRPVTSLRWGTPTPVTVRDPDFKMVQVRANGLCVVKVANPEIFMKEVIGTDSSVDVEEIAELLRRVISLAFSDMVMATKLGVIDLQGRQVELSDKLREFVQERVDDEYGLEIPSITMTISLPDEITAAMTRGVARGVEEGGFLDNVGSMDRYQQAMAAEAMVAAAGNPGGGVAGAGMQLGLGVAMGGQMANMMGGAFAPAAAAPAAPAAPAPPPLPGQVHYHIDAGGQPGGPFNLAQMQAGIAGGQVVGSTLVWCQGMAAWEPAQTVPALQVFFSAPPPLPPSASAPPPMPPVPPAATPGA
jgi:membrane protease subunit (stomatin/prohibitin family)